MLKFLPPKYNLLFAFLQILIPIPGRGGFQVNNDIVYFLLALTHEQESIMPQMQVRGSCQEWKINEKQSLKCKKCSFQFTRLTPRGYADSEKAFAVVLYNLGLSMNAIGNLFNVSAQAVLNWVKLCASSSAI